MNQTGQIIFIIFIVCYIIFWGAIIYIGIPKENRAQQKKKYDERQQIEHGRPPGSPISRWSRILSAI